MTSNHRPQQKRREGPPNPPNPTLSNRSRCPRFSQSRGGDPPNPDRTSPQNQGLVDVNIQTDPYCVLWSHVTMQLAAPPLETSSSNRIRRRVYLISDLYHTVYAPAPTPKQRPTLAGPSRGTWGASFTVRRTLGCVRVLGIWSGHQCNTFLRTLYGSAQKSCMRPRVELLAPLLPDPAP